ncbi:uncharacterized protein LOC126978616 [Leptidea sinapis]|uniref:uncharacterized protein LOC126978616 n=1 Tax=Leptidea sinapis TaxID=189913 RepID=UPI0021C3939D|nr:uncharacterized protein LOC126978616 [Leptidea sinapis]
MFSDNTLSVYYYLSRFWELDTISSKHKLTPEEKRCEQIFADTTYRESDGRFVVTLPLKEPPTILGDSYNMARHRFISLERRLQKNPILQKLYFDFMREYIELGHMTEINSFDWNSTKSKVAPIKPATMPRLELCAALMGARLHSKVLQSLTLKFNESVFWCDSTIVLGWLSMTPSNLKPFVRHRISEIQDIVGGDCWRYVPSAENPADLVSRGLSADKLAHSSLWWSGPQFLQQDQSIWPQFPRSHDKSTLPETVRIFHVNVDGENVISTLFNRCSNFNALQRIVAFMSRFLKNCKLQNQNRTFGPLTTCELNNSLNLILKICQQESFPEEYNLLTSGKLLPPKNKLLSLSPFLDDNKIIRVGGRLHSSFYDYNVKHPVLLCRSNRICNLIFQIFHHKLFHAGPQLLLASIRHH